MLGHNFDKDDGVFWMNFHDFKTFFMRVTVCKLGQWYPWRGKSLIVRDELCGGMPSHAIRVDVS